MTLEEYEKLREIKAFEPLWLDLLNASGYAGVLPSGGLVDRRYYPNAIPVQKNSVFGVEEPKQTQVDLAVQQFIGFTSALTCNKIIDLVESMGLTKEEWLFIRDKESYLFCESQLEEINEHFNIK